MKERKQTAFRLLFNPSQNSSQAGNGIRYGWGLAKPQGNRPLSVDLSLLHLVLVPLLRDQNTILKYVELHSPVHPV